MWEFVKNFRWDEVDVILGNDLAGGKVFSFPNCDEIPVCDSKIAVEYPDVFPVCACDTFSDAEEL